MRRRDLLAATMIPIATGLVPSMANAQSLPDGNLRIIWGYPPGGAGDFIARLVADAAGKRINRNIVVINQPGATGLLAIDNLRRAAPDGLTIMMVPMTGAVLMPMVSKNAKFDFAADVEPVAHGVNYSLGLAVAPSTGIDSWEKFVEWEKQQKGPSLFGGSGLGSISQVFGMMINQKLGTRLEYVPFRGGADLNNAVMGNHVPLAIGVSSDFAPYHKDARMKVLVVSTARRDVSLPDVRSFAEIGHPDLESEPWFGFFAPKGTSAPLVAAWNAAITGALAQPDIRSRIETAGFTVGGGTPDELRQRVRRDQARLGPVVAASGVKMED